MSEIGHIEILWIISIELKLMLCFLFSVKPSCRVAQEEIFGPVSFGFAYKIS